MRRRVAAALALALLVPLPGLAGEVVVKSGETLSEIADRYSTTVNRLMEMNGLRNANDLWAGSRIKVPGNVYSGGGSGNYTVKAGETLSEIADRYSTTVNQLMRLNGLRDANDLWAGSRIQVPGASPRSSQAAVNRNASRHTVQTGETLSEIADRYGVPMSRLVALNNLGSPDQLMTGTTLQIRSTSKPKPKPKPAPAPLAAKPKPKPAVTTAVAPKPQPKPAVEVAIKPEPKPEAQVVVQPQPKPEPKPTVVQAEPAKAKPAKAEPVKAAPVQAEVAKAEIVKEAPAKAEAAKKPAKTQVAAAKTSTGKTNSKASTPDWRSYGPLQVDWANWQSMGGSYVAPSLNSDGQPLYLAINCNAKRLNATGQSGSWKTWDAPQSDFEQQLIDDLCKAKPG